MNGRNINISSSFSAIRIAIIYFVISFLWILLSDRAVQYLFNDIHTITLVQTWKGWGFILVSTLLIYLLIYRDLKLINSQKRLIKESLVEKDILLKEIHHRVKNNMQIITSLLRLQSREEQDNVQNLVDVISGRIMAMAMVHEILYESGKIAVIDFHMYIDKIISMIINTMNVPVDKLVFKNDTEHIELGIDVAIPCGLILVEILKNAANRVGDNSHGVISIHAVTGKQRYMRLVLGDDMNIMNGMLQEIQQGKGKIQLISLLVEQLRGSIKPVEDQESGIIIAFPLPSSRHLKE